MIRVTPLMRAGLLAVARAYAKHARISLRVVSRRVYGDSRFFGNMVQGGNVSGEAYDTAMIWFEDPPNWRGGIIPPGALVDPFAKETAP